MSALDAYREWWRPEFFAAMKLLAAMSDALAAQEQPRPVLVDDAAVEFYSRSAIPAPSVDLLSFDAWPGDPDIETELPRHGFAAVAGTRGEMWTHPSTSLAFRLHGSAASIPVAWVGKFGNGILAGIGIDVIGLEDSIAWLVRRWWREPVAVPETLDQAASLLLSWSAAGGERYAARNYDLDYLDWVVRKATGHACGWPLLEEALRCRLQGLPMPPRPDSPPAARYRASDPVRHALATSMEDAAEIMATRLNRPHNERGNS